MTQRLGKEKWRSTTIIFHKRLINVARAIKAPEEETEKIRLVASERYKGAEDYLK